MIEEIKLLDIKEDIVGFYHGEKVGGSIYCLKSSSASWDERVECSKPYKSCLARYGASGQFVAQLIILEWGKEDLKYLDRCGVESDLKARGI